PSLDYNNNLKLMNIEDNKEQLLHINRKLMESLFGFYLTLKLSEILWIRDLLNAINLPPKRINLLLLSL
ncbi:15816_t:CDS:1, partial [Acaulospora morrowiae]